MGSRSELTDDQFFACLRECAGLYARTVKTILKEYKVNISRQSVRERALKHPEILEDIKQENIDIAEEGLHTLMKSSKQERVRLRAIEIFLRTIGKGRGYVERQEVDLDPNGESINPINWVKNDSDK